MPNNFRVKRGTRAGLNSLGGTNGLAAGEPYLITDEARLAIGTGSNSYSTFVKQGETFTTSTSGLVPAPGTSNATDFLRRDGTWAPPAASGYTTYASVTALAGAAIPADGTIAYLHSGGRSGFFKFSTTSHTTQVTADTRQGIFVAPTSANTGASGVWVRMWDGVHGSPEWFGAILNSTAGSVPADNVSAINACVTLCPVTILSPGKYYTNARIHITLNHRTIRGAAYTQTDQGSNTSAIFPASEIITTSSSATIIQIGSDSSTKPTNLVEAVRLEDFSVNRSVNPLTTGNRTGSIGISCRWCVNCHFTRVFSLNSERCWFLGGVVSSWYNYCSALRDKEGSDALNDQYIGWHFDTNFPSGYNGGNASVTMLYCRAFPITEAYAPSLTYSAGIRMDGGWVDIFIKGLEVGASIGYGIHGIGDGVASTSYRTEDLMITDCVLDPGTTACVYLEEAGVHSAVTIHNCYLAPSPGAMGAIRLLNMAGSATISGNQIITNGHNSVGFGAINVNNIRLSNNIYTQVRQPVYLDSCNNFSIQETISNKSGTNGDFGAIQLTACNRGYVNSIIGGNANAYPVGVNLIGSANTNVEINATNIDANAIAGGYTNKVKANNVQITSFGSFTGNNFLGGIINPANAAAGNPGGGGGLTDGDKGDVVVSNSGTTLSVESAQTNFRVGSQTVGLGTLTPETMTLGATFSTVAGSNPKLKIFEEGSIIYGLGVSNASFEFITPSGATFNWWEGAAGRLATLTPNNFSMLGNVKLVSIAPTASTAGFNLPHGTAPTTPTDGDIWTTTAGIFVRINGATIGPLMASGASADPLRLNTEYTTAPTNPETGLTIFTAKRANRKILAMRTAYGRTWRTQASIGANRIGTVSSIANATTLNTWGFLTYTNAGTGTGAAIAAATISTTNFMTMQPRVTFNSGTTATGIYEIRGSVGTLSRRTVGGGFHLIFKFGINTINSNSRFFCGFRDVAGLAAATISTSVDPSTLLNIVGVAKDAADSSLVLMHNDGTGAATKVPLTNTGAINNGVVLQVEFFCQPGDTGFGWRVQRYGSNSVETTPDEGFISTDIPAIDVIATPRLWIANSAAASSTIDFMNLYVEQD